MKKKYEIKNVTDVIRAITDIAEENTATAKHLLQSRGHRDFVAKAHREKALFSILLLKELGFISSDRYWAMAGNLDEKLSEERFKENVKEWQRRRQERVVVEEEVYTGEELGGRPLLDEEDKSFICPGCKDRLTYQGDYRTIKYCMLCGEKLDWSGRYGN